MTTRSKPRVLMLLENNPYPQDDRVRREAETLANAGYEVRLICPAAQGQKRLELIQGVSVYRYPGLPSGGGFTGYLLEYGYSVAASWILSLRILLRHGFDIVHSANPPDVFAVIALFYKMFGKRFVYDHHDLAPEMYLARFPGRTNKAVYYALVWFERLACKLADRIIATNESYKAVEMARGGVPARRIQVVRNGPDLRRLRNVEPERRFSPNGRIVLSYVGVIGFQDGVDYLLRSLHELRFTLGRTDFTCVIIGAGDALASLQKLSRELNIADHVDFVGWVDPDQVAKHLSVADICVAPEPSNAYTDRSTTIKLMEYMALEKPIVAFDLPEHRVTAGGAAVYVRANDELAFAKAIADLMHDPARCRSLGRLGRQRVVHQLAWSHWAPRLLEMYDELSRERSCGQPGHIRKFDFWLRKRSLAYLLTRLAALSRRYSFNPDKAKRRVRDSVRFFRAENCSPTFPTPGRVVERNPEFCREIQALGAELAVHGYDHVDFQSLSDSEAMEQFDRAIEAFDSAGIRHYGLRCPYLSYSEGLRALFAPGQFGYSSNKAILWDVIPRAAHITASDLFGNLERFYRPEPAVEVVSMPRLIDGLVEIPVSLPDDLQLYDGLKLRGEDLAQPWIDILHETHRQGQIFVLMFHPELFQDCKHAFKRLLDEANAMTLPIWIAPLHDISRWWVKKDSFAVDWQERNGTLELAFRCSEEATVLMRGLDTEEPASPWNGAYRILQRRYFAVSASRRPFLGLPETAPHRTVTFLKQQGYIIDQSIDAPRCSTYLSVAALSRLDTEVKLLRQIESSDAPLIRYSPWPDGKKSALSVTGDLDALSLWDYTDRVFR